MNKLSILKVSASILSLAILINISGCSVYKASCNEGIDVIDIKDCRQKTALLTKGMECIDSKEENGKYIEIYRAKSRKTGLNYVRAVGHGALDVMTCGLWEVVGTPVEGVISNNRKYIVAKATYPNKNSDVIENLEIYKPNGQVYQSKEKRNS